jgi:non-heme chloroperoxidase
MPTGRDTITRPTAVPGTVRHATSGGMVFERRGEGRPVLLLHGWCLNRKLWMYEDEFLAAEFDVTTPDLPGFGHSDGLKGPFTLDRYASDVGNLIRELDLSDVVVVGFAFGAAVAMRLAANGDERLAGLVLVGVPRGRIFPVDRLSVLMQRDWPEFSLRSARAICAATHSDATFDWLGQMFLGTSLGVALETAALLKEFEPTHLAAHVRVPALYIHGADDAISPTVVAEECAAQTRDARLEVLDRCGHLVMLDQRDRFRHLTHEFLRSVDATSYAEPRNRRRTR